MYRSHAATSLVVVLGAACGSPTDAGPSLSPGLHVLSGAGVTDSIDAILEGALQVELIDAAGAPQAGARVRFTADRFPEVYVGPTTTSSFLNTFVDSTDATGRASARIRFGRRAVDVGVSIEVIGAGLRATATYSVTPGAASRLQLAPGDTTLYRGKQYSVGAIALDRYGNVTQEAVGYLALTPTLVMVDETGAVDTREIGRGMVRVSAGEVVDTAFVSIPPEGTLTAIRLGSGSPFRVRIASVNFDGTGETPLVDSASPAAAGFSWHPDGTDLVFGSGGHDVDLFRMTPAGTGPLMQSAPPLQSMAFPCHSDDGEWIFFNGRPDHQNSEIWRVRTDGTGAERVGPLADFDSRDVSPDPSPDGSRVVYSTDRVNSTMPVIRILDLATRSVNEIDVPGVTPRWSPDGSLIAYISTRPSWGYLFDNTVMRSPGFLSVMNADGSDPRIIPTGTTRWLPHFDFSPDGKYIIARAHLGVLTLIEVATGASIPLTFSEGLELPAWMP